MCSMELTYTHNLNVKCPKCGHDWEEADGYEMDEGSETECPKCEAVLECHEVEVSRSWWWGVKQGPGRKP